MNKGAKIFLIIFFLLLIIVGIAAVDIYLSYKTVTDNTDAFNVGTPSFSIGDDNQTVTVSTTVNSPKLGFIPKSIKLQIIVEKDGTQIGEMIEEQIKLGTAEDIEFTFVFDETDGTTIASGGTITITIDIKAIPVILGITINRLAQDIPTQTINISA